MKNLLLKTDDVSLATKLTAVDLFTSEERQSVFQTALGQLAALQAEADADALAPLACMMCGRRVSEPGDLYCGFNCAIDAEQSF